MFYKTVYAGKSEKAQRGVHQMLTESGIPCRLSVSGGGKLSEEGISPLYRVTVRRVDFRLAILVLRTKCGRLDKAAK